MSSALSDLWSSEKNGSKHDLKRNTSNDRIGQKMFLIKGFLGLLAFQTHHDIIIGSSWVDGPMIQGTEQGGEVITFRWLFGCFLQRDHHLSERVYFASSVFPYFVPFFMRIRRIFSSPPSIVILIRIFINSFVVARCCSCCVRRLIFLTHVFFLSFRLMTSSSHPSIFDSFENIFENSSWKKFGTA